MIAGMSACTSVKVTPSATTILPIQNPTGQMPKLVHVFCADDADAVTLNGFVIECWYVPTLGRMFTTNGTNGANLTYLLNPVQQTPTAGNTFFINSSTIELYKSVASASGKWSTTTEYTIEIYT